MRPSDVLPHLTGFGFQHHVQPKVISISQPTELGTVYTPEEIRELADLAHNHNKFCIWTGPGWPMLLLFWTSFLLVYQLLYVDALSFGAKNGMLMGEVADRIHTQDFLYQKAGHAALFESRFVAAQYLAYLKDDLCLRMHAMLTKWPATWQTKLKYSKCITKKLKVMLFLLSFGSIR